VITSLPGGYTPKGRSKLAPPGIANRPLNSVLRRPSTLRPPPLTYDFAGFINFMDKLELQTANILNESATENASVRSR
jgi:hypothetical protein